MAQCTQDNKTNIMKTKNILTTAIIVLCGFLGTNTAKAQYSYTIHWCEDYKTHKGIIFVSEVFNVNNNSKTAYEIVERFEKFSKDKAEEKDIALSCNNSFNTYTQGPGGKNSSYKYDYQDAKEGKWDYNEVSAARTKAIAQCKEYFKDEGYQLITIDLF